ncbi:bestrophin-4-like isoform X1 [Haliotis asinina]|uniref:bestrophin-4-like isoform X1 n=1 Tax=Haliotis asinina TaxID=109174 RepID=UPI0035322B4D
MTIIYQYRVATTSLGGFVKLLAAWKGSVYKLMFKEMLIFGCMYTSISLLYRLLLTEPQRRIFEKIVIHCNSFTSLIPVSFVLGFYVSFVVRRWWQQFMNVPWPDRTLFIMTTYLTGLDERSRIMRRTVARYMLFGLILICRSVSVAVMKRFPTLDHIVEAGFITKDEAMTFEDTQCQFHKFWVPLMWVNSVLVQARREGKIENDFGLRMIIEQLATFRDKCSLCFVYDWITIPLVYTQVVTLAVHMFFAACILGRQFLDPLQQYDGYEYDFYIPVFTFMQFFFYMGWLKVAEQLINPFGEDDDDFDINWLLDRHTAVAFTLVDQCCGKHPPFVKDHFWNDVVVPDLPYTEASKHSKKPNFMGSTYNIARTGLEEQRMFVPETSSIRRRSKSSLSSAFTGSLLSLFRQKSHYDSRDTLHSAYHQERGYSVPNGRMGYLQVPSIIVTSEHPSRRASIDIADISDSLERLRMEGRTRSTTDADEREPAKTEVKRKFSTPFNFNFFSKKETKRPAEPLPASPKQPRFTVELVPPEEQQEQPRKRRTGQILQTLEKQYVSRPPLLSAIEEGNTINSIRQLISLNSGDSSIEEEEEEDVFNEELEQDSKSEAKDLDLKATKVTFDEGQNTDSSKNTTANDTELSDLDPRESYSDQTPIIPTVSIDEL